MRKLMFVTIGFACALISSHYFIPAKLLLICAGVCVAASLLAFLLRGKFKGIILCVFLSASIGFLWTWTYEAVFIKPAEQLIGQTRYTEARVVDFPHNGDEYSTVTLKLIDDELPHTKVLVTDYDDRLDDLKCGDIIYAELQFRSARERYNAEDDYYFSSGTFLRANLKSEAEVLGHRKAEILDWPLYLAESIKSIIVRSYPDDVSHLVKALLTGDKNELYDDDELYVSMKLSGMSHVVAVSGMHVSFIISLLAIFTGRRRMTAFIGIPLVWVFAFAMGMGPSVVRASIMISLMLIAPLLRRENDPLTSLSLALLVLLAANPFSIGSLSLQLSFAAMAGIILITPRIYISIRKLYADSNRIFGRIFGALNAVVSSSIGALVFTTPIAAVNFGYIPLYSVVSNVLCLWSMSAAFILSYPVCAVAAVFPAAGELLAGLVAWLPRYCVFIVEHISRLPMAALYTHKNLVSIWLVFAYAIICISYLLKGRKAYRPILPICCCIITLPIAVFISHSLNDFGPSLTAVDVGQGQCIVASTENGAVMIDCGGKGSAENAGESAAEYLLSSGKTEIELLILTHLHDDHANGVRRLMSYVDVKRLALPEDCEATEIGDSIIEMCYDKGVQLMYISDNTRIVTDGLSLELFAPIGSEDPNENGLIVYGDYGDFDFLISGDAGSGTEKLLVSFYPIGDTDLLVVGHHGSKYSTSDTLLDAITPETALISVGMNSYGHPAEEVLQRLYSRDIEVYRTDQSGNITIMAGNTDG